MNSSALEVNRRNFLALTGAFMLPSRGGSDGGCAPKTTPASAPSAPPALAAPAYTPEPGAIMVKSFYAPEDGINLQPAFQKALDFAKQNGSSHIFSDFGSIDGEMYCPRLGLAPAGADGIPLVVKSPVDIDFAGATFFLKGPGGADRAKGQPWSDPNSAWVGGWLQVLGYPGFTKISLRNVTVDGGYTGPMENKYANVTDKGFRIQDTDVDECFLENVELRNFLGEIYYIGGIGPSLQTVQNCHFHGSPQCAWNPGGVGKVNATQMRAGRSYQAAEAVGGKGHIYQQCEFYDSNSATFFGGPSPTFLPNMPYNYAYWDGNGEKPWVTFQDTSFTNCLARLGAWMRGNLSVTDGSVWFMADVGHLCDVDLQIKNICDKAGGNEAVGLWGIAALNVQMRGATAATIYEPPSDLKLQIECVRTSSAVAGGRIQAAAIRFWGGFIDPGTVTASISGEAIKGLDLFGVGPFSNGQPKIIDNGFHIL